MTHSFTLNTLNFLFYKYMISNLKTGRFEAFIYMDVLKTNVLKSDVLKPDVL
jgi:hypothetical protein